MKKQELLDWFEEVAQDGTNLGRVERTMTDSWYADREAISAWLTAAGSAMKSVFPSGHQAIRDWERLMETPPVKRNREWCVREAKGIFFSAQKQLKDGRIGTLIDGAKAETVGEVLDQAEQLVGSGYLVASAVLAGGALETHLLHLCQRAGLTWRGDGSIEKYNNAIGQHRNAGTEIYSSNYGKLVTGWGGIRNDAAHKPGAFKHSDGEVRRMIDGIRDFTAKTA